MAETTRERTSPGVVPLCPVVHDTDGQECAVAILSSEIGASQKKKTIQRKESERSTLECLLSKDDESSQDRNRYALLLLGHPRFLADCLRRHQHTSIRGASDASTIH